MPDFRKALDLVLKYEGGRVDDPHDPGGRTAFGVTQATFDSYCASCGVDHRDVWTVTPAEVETIYRSRYAAAIRFDDLPDGIGFAVLDGAVNSGPKRAAKWLQAALGVVVDGSIGAKTISAAHAAGAPKIIGDVCDMRLAFLQGLSGWSRYGRGWGSRVEDVRANALMMAHGASAPAAATPELDAIRDAVAQAARVQGVSSATSPTAFQPSPASVPTVIAPGPVHIDNRKPLQPETWLQKVGAGLRKMVGA